MIGGSQHIEGSKVRISLVFTTDGTTFGDPTEVTLKVQPPAGVSVTYTFSLSEITKDSVGHYHKDVSTPTGGVWKWRGEGTGTIEQACQGEFFVEGALI